MTDKRNKIKGGFNKILRKYIKLRQKESIQEAKIIREETHILLGF